MTENEIRQNIVNIAKGWLGCKESDGSHKKIIDLYNSHKPLARGYSVKYTDSWCSTFASAVAIKAGLTDIIPTECGCEKHIGLFQKIGAWQENDAYVPKPGDYIFYDWDDNGKGDNVGYADHVGIVESVTGSTIRIIEGNINDAVGYRNIQVNGRYIRGYGVPNYASKATVTNSTTKASSTTTSLKLGDAVMMSSDATVYGKTQKFLSFVYKSKLYVRSISGDRIVVSTQKTGAVTGAVDRKYLTKV